MATSSLRTKAPGPKQSQPEQDLHGVMVTFTGNGRSWNTSAAGLRHALYAALPARPAAARARAARSIWRTVSAVTRAALGPDPTGPGLGRACQNLAVPPDPTTTPLGDVTVIWASGKPGERRFSGADLARLLSYAMGYPKHNMFAWLNDDQRHNVIGLADVLSSLASSEAEIGDSELSVLSTAAREIGAKMHCPGYGDAAAKKRAEEFIVTIADPPKGGR